MNNTLLLNQTVTAGGVVVWSITGNIVDGAAAAIEGVTVTLTGDASDSTTTDASGDYAFTGLVDGSYTVTPTKAGDTFVPTSDSVTISGASDTSDFVGYSPIWDYDVSDVAPTSGAIAGQLSDWDVVSGSSDGDIESDSIDLADLNGFTPTGVTKAFHIVQTDSESIQHVLSSAISASLTSLRLAFLTRNLASDQKIGVMYLDDDSVGDSALLPIILAGATPNEDWMRAKYGDGTTVEDSQASLGATVVGRRWHWIRYEWNFATGKIRVAAYRVEDSSVIYNVERNMHATGVTLGHVPTGIERIRLLSNQSDTNSYYARMWIGTVETDWPT